MPYKPLRELKPELFADEEDKMNMFAFNEPDSDEELLNYADDVDDDETEEFEMNDADDVPLVPVAGQNYEVEVHMEEEELDENDDVENDADNDEGDEALVRVDVAATQREVDHTVVQIRKDVDEEAADEDEPGLNDDAVPLVNMKNANERTREEAPE